MLAEPVLRMRYGNNILRNVSINLLLLSNVKPTSILTRIRAVASTSPRLNQAVGLEEKPKLVKGPILPLLTKTLIKEVRILPHPLQAQVPILSVLQPLLSGALAISLATNALIPPLPTIPTQISANNAPITPFGRRILVVARNSPPNALRVKPITRLLRDVKLQWLVIRTRFTTLQLVNANPSVLLVRLDCVLPKLPSGTPKPYTARNVERIPPSGIRLPRLARLAQRIVHGTWISKFASQPSNNALLDKSSISPLTTVKPSNAHQPLPYSTMLPINVKRVLIRQSSTMPHQSANPFSPKGLTPVSAPQRLLTGMPKNYSVRHVQQVNLSIQPRNVSQSHPIRHSRNPTGLQSRIINCPRPHMKKDRSIC